MGKVERIRRIVRNPFKDHPKLGEQEERILGHASRGYTNKAISHRENISEEMVAYVLRNGLLKLGVKKQDLPDIVFRMIEEVFD